MIVERIPISFCYGDLDDSTLVITDAFSKYYSILNINKIEQTLRTLTLLDNYLFYCYEECNDGTYFSSKEIDCIAIIGYCYMYEINYEILKL